MSTALEKVQFQHTLMLGSFEQQNFLNEEALKEFRFVARWLRG